MTGVAQQLQSGEFTVLAPSDSAFEKYQRENGRPIDAEVIKNHIIPGRRRVDDINQDQQTLAGNMLKCTRSPRAEPHPL